MITTAPLFTQVLKRGDYCQQTMESVFYAIVMYISYFVLFAMFYYNTYLHSEGKRSALKSPKTNGHSNGNGVKSTRVKSE